MTLAASASGLELARTLEQAGALTPTSLDLSERPNLTLEQLTALATFFGQLNHSSRWWIADLHEYTEMRHGEYVAQVMEATRLSPQTIENIVSVGKRVPPSRRRPELAFSTHAEVASLPPSEQRHWLKVAKDRGLSKRELRDLIRPKEITAGRSDKLAEYERTLRAIARKQQEVLAVIESNGFVFDDIGSEPGNWKHLAFTLYTEICEIDTWAHNALDIPLGEDV